jgi:MYXO-CTERM domain-containing protein
MALAAVVTAPTALAHEGHGLPGVSHWHATDAAWLAMGLAAAALAWWWIRRK